METSNLRKMRVWGGGRAVFFPVLLVALLPLGGMLSSCASDSGSSESAPAAQAAPVDPVKRGEYLVTVGGCNDCHTPWKLGEKGPEPDMTRMLSGHPQDLVVAAPAMEPGPWGWVGTHSMTAFAGPWGVSFSANLTPDTETGMGTWTEDMFVQSMRTGKHWGRGRDILPPMPWPNVAKMTDEDLKATFAYFKSIPAIRNKVPDPLPPAGGAPGE